MNLFIFRIFVSIIMIFFHGLPKLQKVDMLIHRFPNPIGLGSELSLYLVIFAELFCAILIITGPLFRLACIPLMITFFVACFIFHADDPISKIELPFLYLLIYTFLFVHGPGRYAFQLTFKSVKNKYFRWLLG